MMPKILKAVYFQATRNKTLVWSLAEWALAYRGEANCVYR